MVNRLSAEQIVVLGEDDHDRRALKTLLCGLRPDIPAGRVRPLREPMALVKDVTRERIPAKTVRVAALLRAEQVRQPIRCVLMHEPVKYTGRDLGRIGNAKEQLRRAVRPRETRKRHVRDYEESDSPLIAEHVVRLGLLKPPWAARSDSWLVFVEAVAAL